jgi:hypothetical protein
LNIQRGFIQLHRKLLENPIFKKPGLLQLFIYCLLKANHKENEFIFNDELVKIGRGSFLTGRKILSKELKCNESTIYKRLHILEIMQYLKISSTNKFSIITIPNYDKYQSDLKRFREGKTQFRNNKNKSKSIENTKLKRMTSKKVTTKEQQSNTNNNDNNDNIYISDIKEINRRVLNEITCNFATLKDKSTPESSDYAEINRFLKVKEADSFKNDGLDNVRKLLLLWQVLANNSDKIRAGKYFPYIKTVYQTSSYSDYKKLFNPVNPIKETEVYFN